MVPSMGIKGPVDKYWQRPAQTNGLSQKFQPSKSGLNTLPVVATAVSSELDTIFMVMTSSSTLSTASLLIMMPSPLQMTSFFRRTRHTRS
jgi:hypothetical protein